MKRQRGAAPRSGSDSRAYQQVVQEAARLLAQGEAAGFDDARRKATSRLGITLRQTPDNAAIEQAMLQYRALFQADSQTMQLRQLRHTALQAMRLLAPFEPHLVGPVLAGTAPPHSPVHLHLFADTAEAVALFLLERNIPCEHDERRVRYTPETWENRPLYRFVAGDVTVELTVFPAQGLRRRPLSPVDNRPMPRADAAAVAQLLDGTT
ncbi:MAG: hypothetical protein Kow0096_20030 [Thiohalomonadaceae bacterium]